MSYKRARGVELYGNENRTGPRMRRRKKVDRLASYRSSVGRAVPQAIIISIKILEENERYFNRTDFETGRPNRSSNLAQRQVK